MNKLTAGKGFVVCLIVGLAAAAGAVTEASESKVVDSSRTLPGGERVLEQSIVVPADGFRVQGSSSHCDQKA